MPNSKPPIQRASSDLRQEDDRRAGDADDEGEPAMRWARRCSLASHVLARAAKTRARDRRDCRRRSRPCRSMSRQRLNGALKWFVPGAAQHEVMRCRPGTVPDADLSAADQMFAYILTNRRYGVLYVGVTNDLSRRLSEHRLKGTPGFSRTYGLTRLVHIEEHPSIIAARAREHTLKRWRRGWKLKLIDENNSAWDDLANQL